MRSDIDISRVESVASAPAVEGCRINHADIVIGAASIDNVENLGSDDIVPAPAKNRLQKKDGKGVVTRTTVEQNRA